MTISSYYRESDPVLKAKKKVDVVTRVIPFYLNKLEELTRNNGGYLHGGQVSGKIPGEFYEINRFAFSPVELRRSVLRRNLGLVDHGLRVRYHEG